MTQLCSQRTKTFPKSAWSQSHPFLKTSLSTINSRLHFYLLLKFLQSIADDLKKERLCPIYFRFEQRTVRMVNCCGLVSEKNIPVPLKNISVDLQVQDHVVSVSSSLQYVNEEDSPLEAVFVFPLPANAAVCHFSAKIGEQEIVAEVQDRQSAKDQYDDAVSSGQQAFLLEESEESSDVFRLSVGCLSPGQNATITIIYVMELAMQADHALRFCLPAVLNPRYTPAGSGGGIVSEVSSVSAVPYSLSLCVHVRSSNPVSKLESNCLLDPLEFLNSDQTHAKVNLSPGHMFDKDVELFVYYENTHQPTAVVETGVATAPPGSLMADPVLMISLYPEFPEEVMSSLASQGEFVFVIDRSGSMDCMMHHGEGAQVRIESAKDTLLLLLKSLPMGCYFNIYGFGSHFESFFPQSVVYSQDTMEEAVKRVQQMRADMGGTEILQPLEHIYSQPCYPDHPRQLFIFTDGEVCNTKQVLDLVKSNVYSHRCFSFGIGEGASTALISGMAREGSGHAQFITGTDRMQPKVMQSLRFALQPAVDNISVNWTLPDGVTVDTLSPPICVLFQGQRAIIYAQLKGQSSGSCEGAVTVKYNLKNQPVTNQLNFTLKPTQDTGLAIHRLAVRSVIGRLEQEERAGGADVEEIKRKMVELSIQAGVSCVHTAFIGVNKHNKQIVTGPLLQRRLLTQSFMMSADAVCCKRMRACSSKRLMLGASGKMKACKKSKMATPAVALATHPIADCLMVQSNFLDMACVLSAEPEPKQDSLLQLISLQTAAGFWELNASLALVIGKAEDQVTNQKPEQVDGSVWATVLALIWLNAFKKDDQVEWQFVAMKAVSWIHSQKLGTLSQCVCAGNLLLDCQVSEDMLRI
ncbi:von Willebrand factor A domain-containing protein 5A-like isoform X3 [Myxocyprinus asiaticus]|uniref:von Willebrand factor A domain-containing protein 5A-like isoform X3 n=1 Tax=Myxocyprinus asiaticus TaxID=70543 RepID=UPI0022228228|nr:von Willebrand factor A domain-containing protein 5A-like isoform X3 [Myxocyprinus asiaticus]